MVALTNQEIHQTEAILSAMQQLWLELKISQMMKVHILFSMHLASSKISKDLLGDKCEDFMEQGHQQGARDSNHTRSMHGFKQEQTNHVKM